MTTCLNLSCKEVEGIVQWLLKHRKVNADYLQKQSVEVYSNV